MIHRICDECGKNETVDSMVAIDDDFFCIECDSRKEKDYLQSSTLQQWKHASNYGGKSWTGWLVAPCSQHRDSDLLEVSNFAVLEKQLNDIVAECDDQKFIDERWTVVRERHWAVGWVEWIAVKPIQGCDISASLITCAEEARKQLDEYPVLDEQHYSQMCFDEGENDEQT